MRLLAITPGDERDLRPWLEALGRVGLPAVLFREAAGTDLRPFVQIAADHIETVIVHGRHPQAAHFVGAGHGLHLAAARIGLDSAPFFGTSCHDGSELDAAFSSGADYALLSPVWTPTSKPDDPRPSIGIQSFRELAGKRQVLALGGVNAERHRAIRAAGGHGSAVCGDLFGRATPELAAEALRAYS